MRYRTIVADPPWHYPHGYGRGPNGQLPYPTMALGAICELPVSDLADQSAHLYLWTTNEHLRYAFSVVGAWGFAFRCTMVWCKPGLGMGGSYRLNHELILVGERGKHEPRRRDVGTWHTWPNPARHSEKPAGFYDLIETISYGPYLELFARRPRLGWDVWGNEVESDVELVGVASNQDHDPAEGPRPLEPANAASGPSAERCPICEGVDQPGLIHNPAAPYCVLGESLARKLSSPASKPEVSERDGGERGGSRAVDPLTTGLTGLGSPASRSETSDPASGSDS